VGLTVLAVVVGLWLLWLGALVMVLRGLGTAPPPRRADRRAPPRRPVGAR